MPLAAQDLRHCVPNLGHILFGQHPHEEHPAPNQYPNGSIYTLWYSHTNRIHFDPAVDSLMELSWWDFMLALTAIPS
jgi:hypothetical protein